MKLKLILEEQLFWFWSIKCPQTVKIKVIQWQTHFCYTIVLQNNVLGQRSKSIVTITIAHSCALTSLRRFYMSKQKPVSLKLFVFWDRAIWILYRLVLEKNMFCPKVKVTVDRSLPKVLAWNKPIGRLSMWDAIEIDPVVFVLILYRIVFKCAFCCKGHSWLITNKSTYPEWDHRLLINVWSCWNQPSNIRENS